MSKYVKELITDDLKKRLDGVQDALLVNVTGMTANAAHRLRAELRGKQMHVLMVKNSLAARATEGTPLNAAFEGVAGPVAVVWGGSDIVALAKEVTRLAGEKQFAPFIARGGVMDGQQLSAEAVTEVSKWPSREEQLSLLLGQIMSPASNLLGQLISVSGALASQISQLGEEKSGDENSDAETSASAATE